MRGILRSVVVGVKMSLVEMASHKLRSALSIIGVMLGVASLVAMLTLIGGIDVFLNEKMGKWAGSVWFTKKMGPSEEEKIQWSRSPSLQYSDGGYLEENAEDAAHFYPIIERRGEIYILGNKERARVRGVSAFVLEEDMDGMEIAPGRGLSADDFKNGTKNCLISWAIDENIKRHMRAGKREDLDLTGSICTFKNVQFKIVGVYRPIDPEFDPWHLRRCIIVPIHAMQKYMTGFDTDPGSVRISVNDPKVIASQVKRISRTLKSRHRGVSDFDFRTADWLEEISQMLNNASMLMSVISIISLLVGGLSIMNVMLSSISERVHEIGIRKALGAQKLQIFVQFIAETATLSFFGGIVGAVLGTVPLFFKEAIKKSTEGAIEPTILPHHIVFVFGIIVSLGIIFGLYPAVKAARMNPVEALRYE